MALGKLRTLSIRTEETRIVISFSSIMEGPIFLGPLGCCCNDPALELLGHVQ